LERIEYALRISEFTTFPSLLEALVEIENICVSVCLRCAFGSGAIPNRATLCAHELITAMVLQEAVNIDIKTREQITRWLR
jgi:hypothetical protein